MAAEKRNGSQRAGLRPNGAAVPMDGGLEGTIPVAGRKHSSPATGPSTAGRYPCRLAVALDQPIVAEGLLRLLDRHPSLVFDHYVRTVEGLRRLLKAARPDLLLTDLFLGGAGGLEFIREITSSPTAPRVLIFTQHEEAAYTRRALEAGAAGYVMRNRDPEDILDALETVAAGRPYVSLEMRLILENAGPNGTRPRNPVRNGIAHLSARELHIFHLLGERRTTGEIALVLGISAKTVETYYERVKTKLGQRNLRDLCHFSEEWRRTVN